MGRTGDGKSRIGDAGDPGALLGRGDRNVENFRGNLGERTMDNDDPGEKRLKRAEEERDEEKWIC